MADEQVAPPVPSDFREALEALKRGDFDNFWYERRQCWSNIVDEIAFDGDDPESENLDYVVNNDIMSAVARECNRPKFDDAVIDTMSTATTIMGLSVRNAEKLSSSLPYIKGLMRVCKEATNTSAAAYALTALTNLALHPVAHNNLLACGTLQMALGLLHYLDGESNNEIDMGLTSASFICRVVGKEESGPGPDAIKANAKLVEKLLWILTTVLDAGPDGRVIGYHWNPANILSDVATLATSDRNKPLLVDFVLQLVRALELRSDNLRAVRMSIIALSQLSFEPRCKPKFVEYTDRLIICLDKIITTFPESEAETKRSAQVLKATISETDKPKVAKEETKAGKGLFRKAIKTVMTGTSMTSAKGDALLAGQGHIMISYCWQTIEIANEINARLKNAGFKTWIDSTDMGENVNDSMVYAVENALVVLVLFSRGYKESGNCRKECEMADFTKKAMLFLKAEPNYVQEGWLSFLMGPVKWIDVSSPVKLDQNFGEVKDRVNQKIKELPASAIPAAQPVKPVAPSTPNHLPSMVTNLQNQLAEVKSDIEELKKAVKDLQALVLKKS